jgi:uncharacterized RDD family membrane protein YckC
VGSGLTMMSSAQLEILPEDETVNFVPADVGDRPSALKQEVAEKLLAHRQRRARATVAGVSASAEEQSAPQGRGEKKNRVAAAVAERYAQTPSYRAFLAQEAERAIAQAAAAAEVAQRNADAVAAVQGELLAELEKWDAPQEFTGETAAVITPQMPPAKLKAAPQADAPVKQVSSAGLTVRLYEDVGRPRVPAALKENARRSDHANPGETRALDDEIAFRQAPVFEEFVHREPAVPLPANLLEFPRQLVASVKARPRLAEGPLREESGPRSPQLRIFEVEPEQISTQPQSMSMVPEWSSIFLDAHTVTEPVENPDMPRPEIMASLLPPQTASYQLRLMAASMDVLLVLGGFVAFAGAFAKVAGPIELGIPLAAAGGVVLVVLYVAYQLLFFTLSDQTPGMRYARIGLCTFSDENPSRAAMRKRVLAQIVAIVPLGLGLVWALLDDDRLGWHDRMSRMYQRAY